MLKTLNIPIDIFDTSVLVSAGSTVELLESRFREHAEDGAPSATFWHNACTGENKIGITLNTEKMAAHGPAFWRQAIVHESVHAAFYVSKQRGLEISYDNQELIAYLTDYIDSKIAAWLPMPTRKPK
jgi:hypothetical protein